MREGIPGLLTGDGYRTVVLPQVTDAAREALDEQRVRGDTRLRYCRAFGWAQAPASVSCESGLEMRGYDNIQRPSGVAVVDDGC
jgi:hypothetical protein